MKNNTQQFIEGAALTAGWFSREDYARLSADQRRTVDTSAYTAKSQIDRGEKAPNMTPEFLKAAYNAALTDPLIDKKYKDQLALGQRDLQMNLDYMNAKTNQAKQDMMRQHAQQKMQDAEQIAQQGQAYSSYANKTIENRNLEQFGATDLANRASKLDAFNLGNKFEQRYGSDNTPNISLGGQSYDRFGNQAGSLYGEKMTDVINRGNGIINGFQRFGEADPIVPIGRMTPTITPQQSSTGMSASPRSNASPARRIDVRPNVKTNYA